MNDQKVTGWTLVIIILLILWWLSKNALGFLHGDTTEVSSRIVGGESNTPTTTYYPDTGSGCCS
jgi:hypothetical protein